MHVRAEIKEALTAVENAATDPKTDAAAAPQQ